MSRADAAIITNIAADHFGEYGVESLEDLAATKGVVARALGESGCLVLNADNALLVRLASSLASTLAWFSMSPEHPALDAHVLAGGDAVTLHEGRVMLGAIANGRPGSIRRARGRGRRRRSTRGSSPLARPPGAR